ncbi:MAG: hypothetical protein MI757_16380, partial [Pirellulales bacterium]|nr:hypothetical protein [Pirellulales bacterium]
MSAGTRNLGQAAIIEIVVPDGDGVPSQVALPLDKARIADSRYRLFVKFGRVNGWMILRIRDGEQIVEERRFEAADNSALRPALPSVARLVVSVGPPL